MTVLSIAGTALVAVEWGLLAYGRRHLAYVAAIVASACFLSKGILRHEPILMGLSGGNILLFLALLFWRGGPKGRKRASRALGDESRQLRDGLMRRMRQRRVTRPGWSPSPSPSPSP